MLGYPTGIRALLARTDETFVDSLIRDPRQDFWTMARHLSEAGHIAPLATRGIVGQATLDSVVYDAETTHGGSRGPVLGLKTARSARSTPRFSPISAARTSASGSASAAPPRSGIARPTP